MRVFRLHTVLQPLIKDQRVAQIQDRVLIGGALHRFELLGLLALFVDLFQERRELGETEIFSVALFPAEQAEHSAFWMTKTGYRRPPAR